MIAFPRRAAVLAALFALGCGGNTGPDPAADFDHGTAGPGGGPARPTAAPAYPDGPYGDAIGSVVADHEFSGWMNPAAVGDDPAALQPIHLHDFYDPEQKSDVRLLMISIQTRWCSVSKSQFADMQNNQWYAHYRAKGLEILGVLFEDGNEANPGPAQPSDLQWWCQTFAVDFPMVIDPPFWTGGFCDADVTPVHVFVDTRTMKIVGKYDSYSGGQFWTIVDAELAGQICDSTGSCTSP